MITEDRSPAAPAEPTWQERLQLAGQTLQAWAKTQTFWMIIGVLAAILFSFWSLMARLGQLWLDFDGYYAHGALIPIASAYLIWRKREKLAQLPIKGSLLGLLVMIPSLYVQSIAARTHMPFLESVLLLAVLASSVVIIAGWRWAMALAAPILFLALGLPILDRFIDTLTFNLQVISTTVAEKMLALAGQNPLRDDATVIYLDNFTMNIAEACSGLKTTIAVTSSVLFFMMISSLRWWGNAILAVIAIPLSVIINGLRVAMIGYVGNQMGSDAGMQFHDYSGYIALLVCFGILMQITRLLEPKQK